MGRFSDMVFPLGCLGDSRHYGVWGYGGMGELGCPAVGRGRGNGSCERVIFFYKEYLVSMWDLRWGVMGDGRI